jgi:hypothetical protein
MEVGRNYKVRHFPNRVFKATLVLIDDEGSLWFKELGNNKEAFLVRESFIIEYEEI